MTLQWICMQGQRKQDKADTETGPPRGPGTGCVNMQSVRPNVTREHLRHWALQTRILAFYRALALQWHPFKVPTTLEESYKRTLSLLFTGFSLSFLTLHWLYFSKCSVIAVCILISLPHSTIKIGVHSSIQRLVDSSPPRATERKNTLNTMVS